MASLPSEAERPDVPPEVLRGATLRLLRRVIRALFWGGLVLLAIGFAVAVASTGPNVWATAFLSAGLLAEVSSLVARRIEFWAGVYAKDRKTARRVRKPGM